MKGPVHVTVQMATVGLPVEVSALHGVQQLMQVVQGVTLWEGMFLQ